MGLNKFFLWSVMKQSKWNKNVSCNFKVNFSMFLNIFIYKYFYQVNESYRSRILNESYRSDNNNNIHGTPLCLFKNFKVCK